MVTKFRTLDPFMRYSVGFDRLFNELENMSQTTTQNYPPYNVIRGTNNDYRIEIAVSGFTEKELNVEVKEDTLTVSGVKEEIHDVNNYLHKGIAKRDFDRTFTLNADIVVNGASLTDGMLVIELEHVIPEEKKPRTIGINKSQKKGIGKKAKEFLTE